MAHYHISGRPKPPRVHGLLEPGEPLPLPSKTAVQGRSRAVTLAMEALPQVEGRNRYVLPAAASLIGVLVVAVAFYFRAPPPAVQAEGPQRTRAAAKPVRPSIAAGSRPVIAQDSWSYGRVGSPPHQTLPSQAALAAFRNDMEKMAEKQKAAHTALP